MVFDQGNCHSEPSSRALPPSPGDTESRPRRSSRRPTQVRPNRNPYPLSHTAAVHGTRFKAAYWPSAACEQTLGTPATTAPHDNPVMVAGDGRAAWDSPSSGVVVSRRPAGMVCPCAHARKGSAPRRCRGRRPCGRGCVPGRTVLPSFHESRPAIPGPWGIGLMRCHRAQRTACDAAHQSRGAPPTQRSTSGAVIELTCNVLRGTSCLVS
jgi:hypothetical protein